jgi:hypothetical protein
VVCGLVAIEPRQACIARRAAARTTPSLNESDCFLAQNSIELRRGFLAYPHF